MTAIKDVEKKHLLSELQKLGAGEFEHLNGSLATHLIGTSALLQQWDSSDVLVKAGLFHAVYGTAGYGPSLTSLHSRHNIAKLIGQQAEELVYLYCACDRKIFWPKIGSAQQNSFADRFIGKHYPITNSQLHDFCEMTLANELDIAMHDEQFIVQHGAELSDLFMRMKGLVSQAGFDTCKRVFASVK